MSLDASPKVLVVANPDAQPELTRLLVGAGFDDLEVGDGGDETFVCYERTLPDVVVVCADLERGDARALASAIRSGDHGQVVKLVLIGDTHGPVRNALDAADYAVDRFVGRPLSPKALAFAVRSCVQAVRDARGAEEAAPAPVVSVVPPVIVRPTRSRTSPPRLERAVEDAIDDFVRDAVDALSDTIAVARPAAAGPASAGDGDGGAAASPLGDIAPSADPLHGSWDAPAAAPAWREPTLILSGGGDLPAAAPSPPVAAVVATPAPVAAGAAPAPASAEPENEPDEVSLVAGNIGPLVDLAQLEPTATPVAAEAPGPGRSASAPVAAAAAAQPAPSGGGFGRELRRKMSMMAERLFAAQGQAVAGFDAGLAHDHQAEIDLTALGVDTVPGIDHDAPAYDDMREAQTYADDASSPGEDTGSTHATSTAEANTTIRRRGAPTDLPSRGTLAAGELDVPVILARAFAGDFTGRVVLRRGQAEKVLFFDDGRPVFATSNLPHDRMGDLLFREGKITAEHHARSRELVVESGRRMGEILVEMGFLKRRELLPAVRRHIEDIIYSVFGWADGEFHVFGGSAAEGERIRLSRHPAALILEGVRRKLDAAALEVALGPASTVLEPRDPQLVKAIVGAADLSAAERAAIEAFDGQRSVADVAERVGVDTLIAWQLAYGLLVMGAAERAVGEDQALADVRAPSLVGETDLAIDRQRVLAKHAHVVEADYFTLLGVRRDATRFEIRRAYEAARRDYAAECFPGEVRRELALEIDEINELVDEAYQVLVDDELRASYRAHLRD